MVSVARWGSARFPFCGGAPRSSGVARAAFGVRGSPDLSVFLRFLLLLAGRRGGRSPRGGASLEVPEAGTQGLASLAAAASAGDEDGCGKVVVLKREGARRTRSSA